MTKIRVRSDVVSGAGDAAHDVALAALLGGNLFGRVALNSALEDVSDKSERGKVLNRAWRRYGTVNSLALVGLVGGWLPVRLNQTRSRAWSARERQLAAAKDVAIGAVVVSGLAAAAAGVSFAQQSTDGAVPMESGRDTAIETPALAARLKHLVNALGALNLLSELSLAVINASLTQPSVRRRPAWGLLLGRQH